MTAKAYLEFTFKEGDDYNVRPRILCDDGFTMSIQGGTRFHYCTPRRCCNEYDEVEIGYPSEAEPLLFPYAEDDTDYCDTVYGFVPMEIVEKIIEKHGGILA